MLKTALLIAALCIPTASLSQNTTGFFYSGNELHRHCNENRSVMIGFTAGVFDTRSLIGEVYEGWRLCFPNNGNLGQAVDVVCKHVNDNPETRHWGGTVLAGTALHEAFPCPEQ